MLISLNYHFVYKKRSLFVGNCEVRSVLILVLFGIRFWNFINLLDLSIQGKCFESLIKFHFVHKKSLFSLAVWKISSLLFLKKLVLILVISVIYHFVYKKRSLFVGNFEFARYSFYRDFRYSFWESQ